MNESSILIGSEFVNDWLSGFIGLIKLIRPVPGSDLLLNYFGIYSIIVYLVGCWSNWQSVWPIDRISPFSILYRKSALDDISCILVESKPNVEAS
jgi:hypothetical protein